MKKSKELTKSFEKIFYFYPAVHIIEVFALSYASIKYSGYYFFPLAFVLYLQSPLIWRLMENKFGSPKKVSYLGKFAKNGNIWFVSHQLQHLYTSFHYIERILQFFPGFYSFWLRLWGAKIGEKINWTPETMIVDRPFVNIGSKCLIGNRTYISAHALKKKDNKYVVFFKDVEIGSSVVLAYSCHIGPGCKLEDQSFIPAGSELFPNTKVLKGETYGKS